MADDLPLPPWAHSHDAALYRGDFIQVMHLKQEESIQVLCDAKSDDQRHPCNVQNPRFCCCVSQAGAPCGVAA